MADISFRLDSGISHCEEDLAAQDNQNPHAPEQRDPVILHNLDLDRRVFRDREENRGLTEEQFQRVLAVIRETTPIPQLTVEE